jgi:hypothetical protein
MKAPLATTEELGVCQKCKRFDCDCELDVPRLSFPKMADVCGVCRRATGLCICRSHSGFASPREDEYAGLIDRSVNEALRLYYERDAAGLERHVRAIAERMRR